jgi:hypothetical protein
MPASRSELERSLHRCLLERVHIIQERLPSATRLADVFEDADALDHVASHLELARSVGWIEGAADALDLTVLELLDVADIGVDMLA